jgi:hypothetical protein
MSKNNIFSENRGILDDVYSNAADVEDAKTGVREEVRDSVVAGGVLLTSDCPYCGIQWKGIVKWPEIAAFFCGQQVPNTTAARRGITMLFGCRKCAKASPLTMSWEDLDRYVNAGVKTRALPPTIYEARKQILADRAKQQGGAR